MLNVIYYPVSFVLWVWHEAFGFLLGPDSGIAWVLSVMFLVFTLRALLFRPALNQVRSMHRMNRFRPELDRIRREFAGDRQKQAEAMQRLQQEHGVNPLGGCLLVLVQVPVFIGLLQVLRNFTALNPGNLTQRTENYFFGSEDVQSFLRAEFLGARLGADVLRPIFGSAPDLPLVMIPLMIAAGLLTYLTARRAIARQTPAQAANPQLALTNKLMLYVFPLGVIGAPFLPLTVLVYWLANNLWTLGQQGVIQRRIAADAVVRPPARRVTPPTSPRPAGTPTGGIPPTGTGPAGDARPAGGSRPPARRPRKRR